MDEREPNPSEEEMINMQNEASEINEMVDKNIISREEASTFDYATEMEIPKSLLQEPPKLSVRLKQQVLSKFSPEDFNPKKPVTPDEITHEHRFIPIHGTSFHAIMPIWFGAGKIRMQYGSFGAKTMSGSKPEEAGRYYEKGGKFYLHGDVEYMDPSTGLMGWMGETDQFPIVIVGNKNIDDQRSFGKTNQFWGLSRFKAMQEPRAIVLAPKKEMLIDKEIENLELQVKQINEGTTGIWLLNWPFLNLAARTNVEFDDPKLRSKALEKMRDIPWERPGSTETVKEHLRPPVEADKNLISKSLAGEELAEDDEIRLRSLYFMFLKTTLTDEELTDYLGKSIDRLQKLRSANPREEIYNWTSRDSDSCICLTTNQMANYMANLMVRGVDKSKIVPIYDREGNLLWPKD